MNGTARVILECQTCGVVLRDLTPAEAQKVAERPYDFVFFCPPCQRAEDFAAHAEGYS